MPVSLLRPYCTIEDVRREIGDDEDINEDVIREAINEASRVIEDFTGRKFISYQYSSTTFLTIRRYDPKFLRNDNVIILPLDHTPVITITSVTEDDVVLTEGDDYFVDFEKGELSRVSASTNVLRVLAPDNIKIGWGDVVKVQGTFGYSGVADTGTSPSPDLDGRIRTACKQIAANFTGENTREQVGVDGSVQTILEKSIPESAKMLLKGKKKIVI